MRGGLRELNKFTRCESVYISHTERQHLKRIYIVPEFPLFFFLPLYLSFSPFLPAYINKYSLHRCCILSVSLSPLLSSSLSLSLSNFVLVLHFTPARAVYTSDGVSGVPQNECLGFLFLLFGPQPYFCLFYLFTFIFSPRYPPLRFFL